MSEPQPARSQIEKLLELVSPRVGVIKKLTRAARGASEPSPPILYHALLSHFDFRNAESIERSAAGKGVTEDEAIQSAIGEAVERYCAAHPNSHLYRRARWSEVETVAIAPTECVLYSERQYRRKDFPYLRWQPESEIEWLPARELPGNSETFAPASLMYLNYQSDRPENFLCQATSNGLAAGSSLEMAIRNGLYELIERDGFLLHWFNRLPSPEVDFGGATELSVNIKRHYERFGVEIRVYNLTADLPVYVMMAVSLNADKLAPAALIGLGCHPNPKIAMQKALFEICQIRPGSAQKYAEEKPQNRLREYKDVRTLEDHSAYFMIPEHLFEMAFWLENGRKVQLADLSDYAQETVEADLKACVEALKKIGSRVIYADLTTPDVAQFGLSVVRTIATNLQPIHFGCGVERLGGSRLYEASQRLGYTERIVTEDELNQCPHPLA